MKPIFNFVPCLFLSIKLCNQFLSHFQSTNRVSIFMCYPWKQHIHRLNNVAYNTHYSNYYWFLDCKCIVNIIHLTLLRQLKKYLYCIIYDKAREHTLSIYLSTYIFYLYICLSIYVYTYIILSIDIDIYSLCVGYIYIVFILL